MYSPFPGIAASPISLLSMGGVCGRSLTAGKILFTGRQTCSLYLVLWLCGYTFLIDIKTNWRFTVRFYYISGWHTGRLVLWYHVYGSLWTAKIIQTNNLIITRKAGWCYGIMSTVSYEQRKFYRQNLIILLLHGRQLVMMSMTFLCSKMK